MSGDAAAAQALCRHLKILGVKKAAIVLNALADSLKSPTAKKETKSLVECVVWAANELENFSTSTPTNERTST